MLDAGRVTPTLMPEVNTAVANLSSRNGLKRAKADISEEVSVIVGEIMSIVIMVTIVLTGEYFHF